MHREAINHLQNWLNSSNRKPLVLRGARQVGKSTLVHLFCKEQNLELVEVNLEKNKLKELDNRENFSIEKAITEIEIVTKKKVNDKSVIFLDEIQAQALAIGSLRYFYEDRPDIKVIAAGSLLEVVIQKNQISMPVGRVEYYHLGPMTFYEFLQALDEDVLLEEIKKISLSHPPSETLHNRAIELLKEFYLVGGMPEAVKVFSKSKDFEHVAKIQNSLIQTYKDDLPKYASNKEVLRANEIFQYIPNKIGEKVIFNEISDGHSAKTREVITLLSMAHIIYKVTHNSCSGFPLKSGEKSNVFKLYFLDIGLYNSIMGTTWSDIFQISPVDLLIKGNLAEQFTAQHLVFRQPEKELHELSYWLRGGSKNSAEVDFVLAENSTIFPIEVKSGSTGKMRSLWQYVSEKQAKTAIRIDLNTHNNMTSDIQHKIKTSKGVEKLKCRLLNVPLYAIENLTSIINQTF